MTDASENATKTSYSCRISASMTEIYYKTHSPLVSPQMTYCADLALCRLQFEPDNIIQYHFFTSTLIAHYNWVLLHTPPEHC